MMNKLLLRGFAALAGLLVVAAFVLTGFVDYVKFDLTHPTYSSPIALSADDKLLWSVNPDDDSVPVIRTNTNQGITKVGVGDEPQSVALDPVQVSLVNALLAADFTCRTNELIVPVKNNIPSAGSIKVRKCWAPNGRGTYNVRWFAWFAPGSGRSIGLEARVVRPRGITRHHSAPAEEGARRSPRKGFHRLKGVNSIHFKACEVNAEGIFFNCSNLW
jgi:YVTN family beta-propeller protein